MSDARRSAKAPAAHDSGEKSLSVAQWSTSSFVWLSVLLPGAGQFAQRRFGTGAGQLATVGTYLAAAVTAGGGRAFWLALAWNAWSAIDAYWHASDA